MTSHDEYDKILRDLPKDGRQVQPSGRNNDDLHYLASCGYIDIKTYESGQVRLLKLTLSGMKFISEGGFAEQDKRRDQDDLDKHLQRENWITTTKTSKWAIWLSILSLAVAALALYTAWRQ